MEKAEVADFLKALGQDMLEEPADKFEDVKASGAEAGTAHFPIGEHDRAVLEAHDAVVGDGDLEDVGGEVGEGGVAVVVGLTVDIPGMVHAWGAICSSRPAWRISSLKRAR